MKKLLLSVVLVALTVLFQTNSFAVAYNVTETAIFGSGNPSGGWTQGANASEAVSVSLRAKDRLTGATPNDGAGTYLFPVGGVGSPERFPFNFEWSINTDTTGVTGNKLTDFWYELSVDIDPSAGVNFITFNPNLAYADTSLGNNSTASGAGVETGAFGSFNIAQNSQNLSFAPYLGNPNINATYDFKLAIFDEQGGTRLASTAIAGVMGTGGQAVPDGGATASLLVTGLAGLVGFRQMRKK